MSKDNEFEEWLARIINENYPDKDLEGPEYYAFIEGCNMTYSHFKNQFWMAQQIIVLTAEIEKLERDK